MTIAPNYDIIIVGGDFINIKQKLFIENMQKDLLEDFARSMQKYASEHPEIYSDLKRVFNRKTGLDIEINYTLFRLASDHARREGKTLDEFVSDCILEHLEKEF